MGSFTAKNTMQSFQLGYKEWHNILEKEKKHLENKYHQEAFEQATSICSRFEDPQHTLPLQSNEMLKTQHNTKRTLTLSKHWQE